MVCSVKIQNHHHVDIGINHTGGASSKSISPPSGKNDWGMEVNVAGCGDNHQVLLFEHDTNRANAQNAMVFQDGTHWLHHLYGGVTAGEINKVPLNDNSKAVGFNNIYYLSDYGVKNGTHQMFQGSYQTTAGKSVSQADLCPGGEVWPMSMHNEHGGNHDKTHRYACVYDRTQDKIEQARQGTVGNTNGTLPMYQDMVNRICSKKVNLAFTVAPGVLCAQHAAGKTLAEGFCKEGENFTKEPNVCSVAGLSAAGGQATYDGLLNWYCGNGNNITTAKCKAATDKTALSAKYCQTATGRADPWCSCYNITNGVCDANPTAAGCAKKKQTFDKLVAATPSDQQNVWSGMEACFGRVCVGDVFIPQNANQNCDKSVNVCIQNIDIGEMTDSIITPVCDIDSGDGSPSASTPSPAQDSAKSELVEAKAALARGDPGAQERLDAAEAALDAADEAAGETGPRAYIPKSLDGLKNDRKQQIGAGAMGALVIGCILIIVMIAVSAGGGGPAARRFR